MFSASLAAFPCGAGRGLAGVPGPALVRAREGTRRIPAGSACSAHAVIWERWWDMSPGPIPCEPNPRNGRHRVGPDIRRTFHKATRQALCNGLIRQLDDEIAALDQKTLYVPGKPSILVRELGPRQLSDVPRSEVAKLIKYLDLENAADEAVKRAVLNAHGLTRLTAKTSQYLDECLSYNSRRPAEG